MIHGGDTFAGKDGFFFVSIGGSDQIGLNCLAYFYNDWIVLVDIGVGFPNGIPGVQVIIPDLSYILSRKDNVLGLIITHIHEDHCGALQYLLKCFPDIKVYCSGFCGHFIQAKLDESSYKEKVNFVKVVDGQVLSLRDPKDEDESGGFEIEFVELTHSTIEMMALVIKTKYGTVFHTGDWKMDDAPVVGNPINVEKLKRIGDRGVDVMICDSTNAMVNGHSKSEGSLQPALEKLVSEAKGRVLVTLFASNVGRMSTILSIAQRCNRKVCLVGRSVCRVINAARESGYLEEFPASLMISEVENKQYKPEELLILCTGCQAEPLAALTKIVDGRHSNVRFLEGDTVLFSSKIIPGNESAVFALYNAIYKSNGILVTNDMYPIHASGHPARDELRKMYSFIRPKCSIPVHGEELHLREHAKLARECGMERVLIANNGKVVQIKHGQISIVHEVPAGFLCVDGKLFRREYDPVLKARQKISENGVLVIFINFRKKRREQEPSNNKTDNKAENINIPNKDTKGKPFKSQSEFEILVSIFAPGLLDEISDKPIVSDLIDAIKKGLERTIADKNRKDSFSYIALSAAKKICKTRLGKDPIIKAEVRFD